MKTETEKIGIHVNNLKRGELMKGNLFYKIKPVFEDENETLILTSIDKYVRIVGLPKKVMEIGLYTISASNFNEYAEHPDDVLFEIEMIGIPITENWLIKNFGFDKDYKKGYIGKAVGGVYFVLTEPYVLGDFQKHYIFEYECGGLKRHKEFKFVHQLQNFYFAMYGETLQTISEI